MGWPWTGERFPFTNTHELNLDWIIEVIKKVSDEFPDLIKEVNNKLNKAINTGNPGDVLVNIGNDKSEWHSIAAAYSEIIIEAVNEWLDEHPEATTTVQDASITLEKFTDETRYNTTVKQSGILSPAYIGDYITDSIYQPSAVCFNNGFMYCVDAKTDDYAQEAGNGIGTVRKYSIEDNELVAAYNVLVGHGNSIAFDGTYFYIAPIWEYSEGSKAFTSKIYKYSDNFVFIAEVSAPAPIMGVSYDTITSELYALDYSGNIYKFDGVEFAPYTTIRNWNDYYNNENINGTTEYNQDLAVYNNNFYISSPFGNILHGLIKNNNSYIADFLQVTRYDTAGRFILGELEGYEFTDGHLYALMYTVLPSDKHNAFVVELPVNFKNCTSPVTGGDFTVTDFTVRLSATTKTRFSLKPYEIRSILQLFVRRLTGIVQVVEIPANEDITEDYDIYLPNANIMLYLIGHYTCRKFIVSSGTFAIYATEGNKLTLTATSETITIRRTGSLRLVGGQLNVSTPNITETANNFIAIEYYQPSIIVRSAVVSEESAVLYVGTTKLHDYDLYIGSTTLIFMPDSFTFHQAAGYVSGLAQDLHIVFRLPRAIKGTLALTGSFIARGNKGYLDNIDTARDLSDFTLEYLKPDDWTIEVIIRKNPLTAYANVDNNTPIFVNGTFTFTWS